MEQRGSQSNVKVLSNGNYAFTVAVMNGETLHRI